MGGGGGVGGGVAPQSRARRFYRGGGNITEELQIRQILVRILNYLLTIMRWHILTARRKLQDTFQRLTKPDLF